MISVDDTFISIKVYLDQRDLSIKILSYCTSVVVFIETIRQQLPEVNLLQLVPGFYLLLLFFSLILLVIISDFLVRLPLAVERIKGYGIKNPKRFYAYIALSWGTLYLFLLMLFGYNILIPISLDSFNSYGETNLESLWSFNEVINLERILFSLLILLSQTPITILYFIDCEEQLLVLPEIWKYVAVLIVTFSGILTPTVDGYTQVYLSLIALLLYLIIIAFLEKRVVAGFSGTSGLAF